jgi:serine/threonine protein kinase
MLQAVPTVEERARARIGSVLRGKYRLDRILGIGGMAVVYAATHRNRARFAVKVLHSQLSGRGDIRTRFVREGYASNSVEHPGAVLVVDDDVAEDGSAFLVMELLDGICLETLWTLHRNRLPVRAALAVGRQVLDVLAAAHARSIIHRDVKPANLFVTRDGTVKVLDFGIARVRDAAAQEAEATGVGALLGTPAFMAPEQAMGASEIDARSDLWSVGATLFLLIAGRKVHEGESTAHALLLAYTRAAPSLAAVAPETDPRVVAIVDRALAFSKEQRWPTAVAMRDALSADETLLGRQDDRATLAALSGVRERRSRPDGLPEMSTLPVTVSPVTASAHQSPWTELAARSPLDDADNTSSRPLSAPLAVPLAPEPVPRRRGTWLVLAALALLGGAAAGAHRLRARSPALPSAPAALVTPAPLVSASASPGALSVSLVQPDPPLDTPPHPPFHAPIRNVAPVAARALPSRPPPSQPPPAGRAPPSTPSADPFSTR